MSRKAPKSNKLRENSNYHEFASQEQDYTPLPTGLEGVQSRGKLQLGSRGFSTSDVFVQQDQFHMETSTDTQNKGKSKTMMHGILQRGSHKGKGTKTQKDDTRKTKENNCYVTKSPIASVNVGHIHFPEPTGPVGVEGFSRGGHRKSGGYEINDFGVNCHTIEDVPDYEDIDKIIIPPTDVCVPMSPERIPWYPGFKKMNSQKTLIKHEQHVEPKPQEPMEDYMDMESANNERNEITAKMGKEILYNAKWYDKVPEVIPPIRRTINHQTVHSHSLSILREEHRNKVPEPPKREESLTQYKKNKKKKNSGYDFVDVIKATKNETNPTVSELNKRFQIQSEPNVESRTNTIKILNSDHQEETPKPSNPRENTLSHNNARTNDDQGIKFFHQLSDARNSRNEKENNISHAKASYIDLNEISNKEPIYPTKPKPTNSRENILSQNSKACDEGTKIFYQLSDMQSRRNEQKNIPQAKTFYIDLDEISNKEPIYPTKSQPNPPMKTAKPKVKTPTQEGSNQTGSQFQANRFENESKLHQFNSKSLNHSNPKQNLSSTNSFESALNSAPKPAPRPSSISTAYEGTDRMPGKLAKNVNKRATMEGSRSKPASPSVQPRQKSLVDFPKMQKNEGKEFEEKIPTQAKGDVKRLAMGLEKHLGQMTMLDSKTQMLDTIALKNSSGEQKLNHYEQTITPCTPLIDCSPNYENYIRN